MQVQVRSERISGSMKEYREIIKSIPDDAVDARDQIMAFIDNVYDSVGGTVVVQLLDNDDRVLWSAELKRDSEVLVGRFGVARGIIGAIERMNTEKAMQERIKNLRKVTKPEVNSGVCDHYTFYIREY